MANGWIGVDLDGTLAKHYWPEDGPYDELRIGDPVPLMAARVAAWHNAGQEVRIVTARVGPQGHPVGTDEIERAIAVWCVKHLGFALTATATKDYSMIELWDDRCVRVITDTGERCCG